MGLLSFSPPRQPNFCTRVILSLVRVGKEWAGQVLPHLLKSKGCMYILDRVRLTLSLVRVRKEWTSRVFLHPDNHPHKLTLYLVRVGKEWAGLVFPYPLKSQDCLHIHDRVWLMFSLVGVEKEWTDPDLQTVDAFTFQCGERMGQPNFSPPQ